MPSCSPVTVITGISVFLQRVAEMDDAVAEAAGAREADVVGAQHLEHLGAHQAHDQRDLEQARA